MILSTLRRIIPGHLRARLRRSRMVNQYLKMRFGGVMSKPHPHAPYKLHFDGYRSIGWALGDLSHVEASEMALAAELLGQREVRCAWDIGANVGFWSLFFAGWKPEIEMVVCFEPDVSNFEILSVNKDRNKIDSMLLRRIALSDHQGEATFYGDAVTGATGSLQQNADFIGRWYGRSRTPSTVPLSTIDLEVAGGTPVPDFMKIDVEGHELEVLRGGVNTLRNHHPTIVVEVSQYHHEVGVLLRDLGYFLIDPATRGEIAEPVFYTVAVHRASRP